MSDNKKRHHYVPISYLNEFTDSEGKIFVYRKDDERLVLHQRPDNTAFRKYYYAQPTENGGRDYNALEDQFCVIETKWGSFIDKARNNEVGPNELDTLVQFMALQLVRVPATRDVIELNLADQIKAHALNLDKLGELPPPPEGYENILSEIGFSISPHKSIEAMAVISLEFGQILERLGLGILHNETSVPFITSDAPVFWFNPEHEESKIVPYSASAKGDIILFFPLTPDMIIIGSTMSKADFDNIGFLSGKTSSKKEIEKINRLVAKFSYEAFFGTESAKNNELLAEFADHSPTIDMHDRDSENSHKIPRRIFAKRREKSRWEGR